MPDLLSSISGISRQVDRKIPAEQPGNGVPQVHPAPRNRTPIVQQASARLSDSSAPAFDAQRIRAWHSLAPENRPAAHLVESNGMQSDPVLRIVDMYVEGKMAHVIVDAEEATQRGLLDEAIKRVPGEKADLQFDIATRAPRLQLSPVGPRYDDYQRALSSVRAQDGKGS